MNKPLNRAPGNSSTQRACAILSDGLDRTIIRRATAQRPGPYAYGDLLAYVVLQMEWKLSSGVYLLLELMLGLVDRVAVSSCLSYVAEMLFASRLSRCRLWSLWEETEVLGRSRDGWWWRGRVHRYLVWDSCLVSGT